MKKSILLLVAVLAVGCSVSEVEPAVSEMEYNFKTLETKTIKEYYPNDTYALSEEDVEAYVKYLDLLESNDHKGKVKEVVPVSHDGDVVYYIINFEDGWQLLSSDKRGPIILGQSKEGNFHIEEQNPAVMTWIDCLVEGIEYRRLFPDEYYASLDDKGLENEENSMRTWLAITADTDYLLNNGQGQETKSGGFEHIDPGFGHYELVDTYTALHHNYRVVDHLIKTKWRQDFDLNAFCPLKNGSTEERCPLGCVPLAAAQILYYYHYKLGVPETSPSSVTSFGDEYNWSINVNDFSATTWDMMGTYNDNFFPKYDHRQYGAMFAIYVAILANTTFHSSHSWALPRQLKERVFRPNGIDCDFSWSYDSNEVYENLLEDNPVIFAANSTAVNDTTFFNGHALIIDGFSDDAYVTHYVYQWVYEESSQGQIHLPAPDPYEVTVEISSQATLFKMNWGYGSDGDNADYAPNGNWSYNGTTYSMVKRTITNFRLYEE